MIRAESARGDSRALLARGARELGLQLTSDELEMLEAFQEELLNWNQRINLTAITSPEEVAIKHLLDSLTVLRALPPALADERASGSLADVGSGGGLPGIPLAIVRPCLRVSLIEATRKKCSFLEHVAHRLSLTGVTVLHGRAEELAHRPDLRERYDVVVARAVGALAVLAELCLPLVRPGGYFIAMKTPRAAAEIAAARRAVELMGGGCEQMIPVRLPILDQERLLVVIEKQRLTPALYPRRPGVPARSPL